MCSGKIYKGLSEILRGNFVKIKKKKWTNSLATKSASTFYCEPNETFATDSSPIGQSI